MSTYTNDSFDIDVLRWNCKFISMNSVSDKIRLFLGALDFPSEILSRLRAAGGRATLRDLFTRRELRDYLPQLMIASCFLLRNCKIDAYLELERFDLDSDIWIPDPDDWGRRAMMEFRRAGFILMRDRSLIEEDNYYDD